MKKPKSIVQQMVEAVDGPPKKGESELITKIRALARALEAGNYNAKPTKLHQCRRDGKCGVAGCDPSVPE